MLNFLEFLESDCISELQPDNFSGPVASQNHIFSIRLHLRTTYFVFRIYFKDLGCISELHISRSAASQNHIPKGPVASQNYNYF
jgi:hypothetical protein